MQRSVKAKRTWGITLFALLSTHLAESPLNRGCPIDGQNSFNRHIDRFTDAVALRVGIYASLPLLPYKNQFLALKQI
jgi:hypothetical protein